MKCCVVISGGPMCDVAAPYLTTFETCFVCAVRNAPCFGHQICAEHAAVFRADTHVVDDPGKFDGNQLTVATMRGTTTRPSS